MAESKKTLITPSTLAWLIVIIGGIYGLSQYIDRRINKAINTTEFIQKIASHVRPYIIFDTNETILVDGGAMQYLQGSPKIRFAKKNLEGDFHVIVTPKDYLSQAPLIESLCTCEFIDSSQRGKGLEWIYYMELVAATIHWEEDKNPCHKFRLEIIR